MYLRLIRAIKVRPYREIAIFTVPIIILLIVIITSFVDQGDQQFSRLAQAFLHGHTNFLSSIGGPGEDPVLWHGKIYFDEQPLPSIILMPFVAFFKLFNLFFYQGYLQWILVIGVLFFIFKLASRLAYSVEDSVILALGFSLGSVFIGIASSSGSWYFAQALTTFLLFWSLYEFYSKKRWWIIGILGGLIVLTRPSAAPVLMFFGLELWTSIRITHRRLIDTTKLFLPTIGAIGLIGIYNFVRFHNPLNGGYSYQVLPPMAARSRVYGLFSLIHVPSNFYYAFLSTPLPVFRDSLSHVLKLPYLKNNPYGMSIFITSPYLLYLFTLKRSSFDPRSVRLIIAILISCLIALSWYVSGYNQFGYRYALDFLPEIFLLFMIKYRQKNDHLSTGMKSLLLGSGVVNFYLLLSFL